MAPPAAVEVLIVDDEEDIRWIVQVALEVAGFRETTTRTGAEALTRLEEDPPTVVLLDLNMPVMSGWDFLAWLAKLERTIPVVIWRIPHPRTTNLPTPSPPTTPPMR